MKEILVLGLNHKTAPVEIRERLSFQDDIEFAIRSIKSMPNIDEVLVVSTCNRVEVIGVGEGDFSDSILKFLEKYKGIEESELLPHIYKLFGKDAIAHIFRVCSSLDSMVLGEPQILGQMKDAFYASVKCGGCGIILNRLMHKAFSVAKRVRAKTGIGQSAVSISYVAVELAKKIFEDLSHVSVMVIGAGEMAELAAMHFLSQGVKNFYFANRTYEKSLEFAKKFFGKAIHFQDLSISLHLVDVILCSTGAPHYVVTYKNVKQAMKLRKNKPIFFIDISVPRNIDPKIDEISNVYLYDIDDLKGVVEANIEERRKEAKKAEKIVEEGVSSFIFWLNTLKVAPTIQILLKRVEEIRRREVEKALAMLSKKDIKKEVVLDHMTKAMVKKIFHLPITKLKEMSGKEMGYLYIQTFRTLFDLNGYEKEEDNEDKDRNKRK